MIIGNYQIISEDVLKVLSYRMFEKSSCEYQNVLDPPKSLLTRGTLIILPIYQGVKGDTKVPKVTAKQF